jgi:CelD/BcsL family acetyltransferase involved in cellulose biosynthesis
MPSAERRATAPPLEAVFEPCPASRFRALAPEWQELAEASAEVPFFMGGAWIESWLEVFGEELSPRIFRVARGDRWIGAALFAERRERRGPVPVRCLHLHTSGETPGEGVCVEYDRVLARGGEEAAVADALAARLAASRADEVAAGGLTESALELLRRALPGWHEETMWSADPFVDLAALRAAGGDYRRTALSRSTRTLVGRSLRAYEEVGPLSVEIAADVATGTAMLEELVGLHQAAWLGRGRGGAFASPRNRAFHARLVERALPTGGIQLVRVRAGEETVGLLYSFVDRGRVFFYQSGLRYRDENRFRPGLVAHVCAIERCLALGLDEYHFLAGDETTPRYKASLSNAERKLAWVQLQRPGLKTSLIRGLRGLKRRLEAKHG